MAPESLAALGSDNTVNVDGYFRGTLVDGDGKFTHQVLLKEVNEKGVTALDPLSAANAVQIAAMQAQLERMEGLLEHGIAVIEAIKGHLEVQQAAEINAALGTLRRVYADTQGRDGVLGEIDWTRLAHLEYRLSKGLDAVEQELESVAHLLRFTGEAAKDVEVIKGLTANRVQTLVQMHLALEAGLRHWVYLMAVRKQELGEHDPIAIERHYVALDASTAHRQRLVDRILTEIESAAHAEGRPWHELLFGTGLPRGWAVDERRVNAVEEFKSKIKGSDVLKAGRRDLPGPPNRLGITRAPREHEPEHGDGDARLLPPCGTATLYARLQERSRTPLGDHGTSHEPEDPSDAAIS